MHSVIRCIENTHIQPKHTHAITVLSQIKFDGGIKTLECTMKQEDDKLSQYIFTL